MIRQLSILIANVVVAVAHPAMADSLRTVALGDTASFSAPLINSRGQVAFRGTMINPDGSGYIEGIWSEGTGSLKLITGRGKPAPGLPTGAEFVHIDSISFNNNGQVAFMAQLEPGLGGVQLPDTTGIWSEGTGPLELVARLGAQAPGLSNGTTFGFFFEPVLSDSGDIAFSAQMDGNTPGEPQQGIWSTTSGSLRLVALNGSSAPGAPGVFRDTLNFTNPGINNAGRIAFYAELNVGGSITNSNFRGIWSDRTGTLQLVARQGSRAGGLPNGDNFSSFGTPVLNSAEQVAFRAALTTGSGDVTRDNNDGIWTDRGGELTIVYRKGDPTSALGIAELFHYELFDDPVINHSGKLAFAGRFQNEAGNLAASLDSALLVERHNGLELVAREGDHAPGTPTDAVFDDLANVPFAFNDRGQMAFLGELKTGVGGVSSNNRRGIWATDAEGQLQLIARVGDLLELSTGESREIRTLSFIAGSGFSPNSTGNDDGRPSGFNDRGELAFAAEFADFSRGVFVSSLVVPEPASITLILANIGLLLRRRVRKAVESCKAKRGRNYLTSLTRPAHWRTGRTTPAFVAFPPAIWR
jgi:hypothetical protein